VCVFCFQYHTLFDCYAFILLQPLRWCCVDCVIHHERDVREEQKYMCVARTGNNRVISSGDLCCCLLPRCEALRTCRSGFPIATIQGLITKPMRFFLFSSCNPLNITGSHFLISWKNCVSSQPFCFI